MKYQKISLLKKDMLLKLIPFISFIFLPYIDLKNCTLDYRLKISYGELPTFTDTSLDFGQLFHCHDNSEPPKCNEILVVPPALEEEKSLPSTLAFRTDSGEYSTEYLPFEDIERRKQAIFNILKGHSNDILRIAQWFNIDPIHIIAPIVVEAVYNTDFIDVTQDFLASYGIDLGWTLGLAQISTKTAREYFSVLDAVIDFHHLDVTENITHEYIRSILPSSHAFVDFLIVAAIAKDAIETYKKCACLNIERRPDLIVTLYNLGNISQHAYFRFQKGGLPQVNLMGKFALILQEDISNFSKELHTHAHRNTTDQEQQMLGYLENPEVHVIALLNLINLVPKKVRERKISKYFSYIFLNRVLFNIPTYLKNPHFFSRIINEDKMKESLKATIFSTISLLELSHEQKMDLLAQLDAVL